MPELASSDECCCVVDEHLRSKEPKLIIKILVGVSMILKLVYNIVRGMGDTCTRLE